MLVKLYTLVICFLLLINKNQAQDAALTAGLQTIANDEALAGMSVIAIRGDSIAYQGYFGKRNIASDLPVNANTRYRIASISKSISAVALMKLYEQNLFQLDDDVSSYLGFTLRNPNFPSDKITFRMLLSHKSSIQDGTGYNGFLSATSALTPPPISQLLTPTGTYYTANMFRTERPGTYFNYSNVQFGVIGTLVEKISNQRFDIYVRQNILQPLGITGSFNIDDIAADINDLATLYRRVSNVWTPQADNFNGVAPTPRNYSTYTIGSNGLVFGPQGNLRISARELAIFTSMISRNGISLSGVRILNDSTVRRMRNPEYTYTNAASGNNYYGLFRRWGLGLQISTANPTNDQVFAGKIMWGHTGEAYGLISDTFIDTATKTGVVFITNGKFGSYTSCNTAFYCVEEKVFNAVNTFLLTSLPVTIDNFSLLKKNNQIQLFWNTLNEINNNGFEIERSTDGNRFTTIAFVASKALMGNSTATNQYTFNDLNFSDGINYYRLKQVDKDGKITYSIVKQITISKINDLSIQYIYPNPATNFLNIAIGSFKNQSVSITIINALGVQKINIIKDIIKGNQVITLPISRLINGAYSILLNGKSAVTFIKK
jgi:CubicO group peptidase (beta-lactamase class C family)